MSIPVLPEDAVNHDLENLVLSLTESLLYLNMDLELAKKHNDITCN